MRRLSKVICIALSMMLLVNLVGIEAYALDADAVNPSKANQENKDDTSESENKADDVDNPDDSMAGNEKQDDQNNTENGNTDTLGEDGSSETDGKTLEGDDGTSGDVGLDTQLPTREDKADEAEKSIDTQDTSGLKAKPVAGKDQLEISWEKVNDATGYKVVVTEEGQSAKETIEIKSADTVTKIVDVTPGKKYNIKVSSTKDSGDTEIGEIPAILLAAPANLKAVASNGAVTLTWSAVAGAQSYKVEYNGVEKEVSSPSCTITGLKNGTNYTFSVTANTKYDADYLYSSAPATASVAPMGDKPAQVTGLSGIDGEKSAILTWSKAAYADSYAIYRYNTSKKTWDVVKNGVTQLTYTDNKLTAGKKYQYRVAGVNENGTGALSAAITISVKKTPGTKVRSIGYKATVKSRAPLFATSKSSKRLRYLKKGTKVTTTDYARGRYEIKVGGKIYWISKDRLKFRASVWTTKDYSTKVKEDFVNKRGYKSPTKYLIWISQYTQRVIIYQGSKGKWKMIRNCRCATGTHLHMTPKGVFKVGKKEKGWFYKKTFEKPIVHFKSQNSFHSRIKNYKGGYADATIGRPRSKGCVRLYDEDINFIYKKCPKGTTVVSL